MVLCGLSQEVAGGSDVPLVWLSTEDMTQHNHGKQRKQQRVDDADLPLLLPPSHRRLFHPFSAC